MLELNLGPKMHHLPYFGRTRKFPQKSFLSNIKKVDRDIPKISWNAVTFLFFFNYWIRSQDNSGLRIQQL